MMEHTISISDKNIELAKLIDKITRTKSRHKMQKRLLKAK